MDITVWVSNGHYSGIVWVWHFQVPSVAFTFLWIFDINYLIACLIYFRLIIFIRKIVSPARRAGINFLHHVPVSKEL